MTPKQLEALVSEWQARMGLDHWRISVEVSSEREDYFAATAPSEQYRTASIKFDPDFAAKRPEEAVQTIVHELLHIAMRDVDSAVEAATAELHPAAAGQASKRYTHAVEGFVDALAVAITNLSSS